MKVTMMRVIARLRNSWPRDGRSPALRAAGGQQPAQAARGHRQQHVVHRGPTIVRDPGDLVDGAADQGEAAIRAHQQVQAGLRTGPGGWTIFRIGSITKTSTAIAVLQLWERGLVDLDAPATDYLRSFKLVPRTASFRPATVRHLLTHTAGIGYWPRLSDVMQPGVGAGVQVRGSARSVADYYRPGPPIEVEPGTKWVYSNDGFSALGQLVEDVSAQPWIATCGSTCSAR